MSTTIRKKLVEVALPLDEINVEASKEKSIRHGHPSTLHLWWARRPLAVCRAILFASLVDDPSSREDLFPTVEEQDKERLRLFSIISRLSKWENSNNIQILEEARQEIRKHCGDELPVVFDPFCGGGSIPLEGQRLGLKAFGSDLNPVAVLITRALINIPARFRLQAAINSSSGKQLSAKGLGRLGLVEDLRSYGQWMKERAVERIGKFYPLVDVPKEYGGGREAVVAWIWARTVSCPNPACSQKMPLVRSFLLSGNKDNKTWVEPIFGKTGLSFEIRKGKGKPRDGTVNRRGATCLFCNTAVPFDHVRSEGKAGRMSHILMAIVAEGRKGRLYLPPDSVHSSVVAEAAPSWEPTAELPSNPRDFKTPNYGMRTFSELFTRRQLLTLTVLTDLVKEARAKICADAIKAGLLNDGVSLNDGGVGAQAYADALATYLAFAVDRTADYNSTICSWNAGRDGIRGTFARQAVPMTWDFAEANPLGNSSGNFFGAVELVANVLNVVPIGSAGESEQLDATSESNGIKNAVISTDPPYYDNIGYADLSDYFYIWLRKSLQDVYPELFSTLQVPKSAELVATPYRFDGDKQRAKEFFEEGLVKAFNRMSQLQNSKYPLTVYYAFKQTETEEDDVDEDGDGSASVSTGWETMLEGLIRAGFSITGTWPMRSERTGRTLAVGTNALASCIVLVCRKRDALAPKLSRREFVSSLKKELPIALKNLQHGGIAPVDLAQAAIGPGMSIYSRYSEVVEADGSRLSVRKALQLINQSLDEVLSEQDSDYDPDTRWAISWFEQNAFEAGAYGSAEVLSKAKDTSLTGLVSAGIIESKTGKVRLLRRDELDDSWSPSTDTRLTIWEITHHLIRSLEEGGKARSASVLNQVGGRAETALELAYRLYGICERKKWAQDALAYNSLVVSWAEIKSASLNSAEPKQLLTSEI